MTRKGGKKNKVQDPEVKAKLRLQMRTFISNSLKDLETKMKRAKLEEVPEIRPRGQSEQIFSNSNVIKLDTIR